MGVAGNRNEKTRLGEAEKRPRELDLLKGYLPGTRRTRGVNREHGPTMGMNISLVVFAEAAAAIHGDSTGLLRLHWVDPTKENLEPVLMAMVPE